MDIKKCTPMVLFDNQCYLCAKFAGFVNLLGGDKIMIVGHYSNFGMQIRSEILDESALEMFWFIDKKFARGGRAALIPLLRAILSRSTKLTRRIEIDEKCQQDCKTIKAVFVRTSSLLTNSRKIELK